MIWYILLLFFVSFGKGAIFYVRDNDRNSDPSYMEYFKLLGLRLDTNSDILKNDLNEAISAQVHKIGNGKYDESLEAPMTFNLGVHKTKDGYESSASVFFDYAEKCKSLVGTSISSICRLIYKGSDDNNHYLPRSCKEILDRGYNKSGIYEIHPYASNKPFLVLCDMETRGGGWTHIQKRFDESQDFYLGWRDYKFGFGDLDGEFWIGLENMHQMTAFEENELLIELTDRDGKKGYAQYSVFAIGAEKEGYNLKDLKDYSGDIGDALTPLKGQKFTTLDVDQDGKAGANCAILYEGAWWYSECHTSNLNGKHMNKPLTDQYKFHGLNWNGFRGHDYNLAGSRMLIRPASKH
ncbi:microfibril-associated glycoprotein 4-like [Diorhabda sublineata]|uniref:microfibril-associated glycoprotein 4-like n=1 Tax=Diorhabda sublineata TaxID=1163346 RepID=UPI0024E0D5AF|nr:microfibril-associated glycoprotein 4-like [Diorhabda sublineata]